MKYISLITNVLLAALASYDWYTGRLTLGWFVVILLLLAVEFVRNLRLSIQGTVRIEKVAR